MTKTLATPAHVLVKGSLVAGKYRIIDEIGRGGMGIVYHAEDTTLAREVAIKVLPEIFAADPDRVARFEREAKLLATLNHPNIAAIHGLEESEGRRLLVLELAEGETLQARLGRGPLPLEDALETCREIAAGLEAAHEKGIVHRDLKPGNVMIAPDGKVKILDFGLAKADGGGTNGFDIEKSPPATPPITERGVILGTAAYMSPEQARSQPVDKRTDIWAFGCVFYECLAGTRAFHGETVADTLAHILKGEPDWSNLPQDTPIRIRTLLRRCLEKNPSERLRDIGDARLEIASPEADLSEATPAHRRFSLLPLAACAVVALIAGLLLGPALMKKDRSAPPPQVVSATIKLEPGHWLIAGRMESERPSRTAVAISHDGQFVVYGAVEENPGPQSTSRLYLRRMGQTEAKPIPGTEGGWSPFLSPDDRWVGFWVRADAEMKKVPIEGGIPTTLCRTSFIFGANWGRDNRIIFAEGDAVGLSRVSGDGGTPEILTAPDPKREESSHGLPFCLPDGKAVLFTVKRHGWDHEPWLAVLRLDTREWQVLLEDAADAKFVPTGHLVFLRQGTLMAVPFDLARLEVVGRPVALVENVMQAFSRTHGYNTGSGQFGVSDTGSLIYAVGGVTPEQSNSLVWVDQQGVEQSITDKPFAYYAPRLSPDGQRIAYSTLGRECKLWVYDTARGTHTPLTNEGAAFGPAWSPDGRLLLFGWMKSVASNLFWMPYDGSLPMTRLTTSAYDQFSGSWSKDGNAVAILDGTPDGSTDIAILDVPSKRVSPFLKSPFVEMYPEFSPDGRWLAYVSDESNKLEVWVRAFPGPGVKQQVSSDGGLMPLWARDGKRLFFRSGASMNKMWVVDIHAEGGFATGKPRLLFDKAGYGFGSPGRTYDLSLDSKRFLMVKLGPANPTPVTELVLVQNWFEELKRLVPTGKK